MASHPIGMNESKGAKGVTEEDAAGSGAAPSTTGAAATTKTDSQRQQQSNGEISGYSDKQLKALLDEAITYKNPKDLEHKSDIFKELLKRAEAEAPPLESSFAYMPFTSSGGGSLQNIFESANSEPRKFSSAGSANPRRHHISGHGYGRHSQSHYYYHGGGHSGAGHHQHHHGHHSHQRGHGGGSGFVSSRQGEGGSLPSNVNTRSVEMQPFIFAEMDNGSRRRAGGKTTSESSRVSDEFEMGVMNGGEPQLSKAAARSVAARGTSLDTDIPYAQMSNSNMSVLINMGDDDSDNQEEDVGFTGDAKKATSSQQSQTSQQQQQNYRTNVKIDLDGASTEHEKGSVSSTMGGYEKLATSSGLSASSVSASGGGSRNSESTPITYEQVDKSIKMSLEPKAVLDPLANAYVSVKNARGDQKQDMIIVTPSTVPQSHDREMSTDLDWTRSMSIVQQKRLKHRRKYERNMTTIVSDEIIGFRGKEEDLDRLVQFIESTDNDQQTSSVGKQQRDQQKDQQQQKKNKGTNKKDHGGGGKLKKSNSMNELRSGSKMEEMTSEKSEANAGVVLRQKAPKNKTTTTTNSHQNEAKASSTVTTTTSDTSTKTNGKQRGDRRSWGTEELQYLGDSEGARGEDSPSFIVDTNNNMSGLKKQNKKQEKLASTELSIPTKTLGELPVNSVSMESLVSSSWANEEFHVVTKKRKSKKKQPVDVQPFEVERRSFNNHQSSFGGVNAGRRSQEAPLLQKGAKNRPNNLLASITSPATSSSSHRTTPTVAGRSSLHPAHGGSGAGAGNTNQSKSRRKSTSSVPPSDHSDCSDLDSVHSLPIESPSTTKSKANAAKAKAKKGSSSSNRATGGNGGGGGISYADITKTANSQKSPQATAAPTTVSSANGAEEDMDTKWPLIADRGGRQETPPGKEEESSITKWAVTNGEEKLQKMSDIIKNSQQASVVRSTEVINVTAPVLVGEVAVGGSKTLLQKSKSVDNESSGFNMNIDQYPSLEKTVNKKQTVPPVGSKESPTQPPVASVVANGAAGGKKLKLLSSIVSDTKSSSPSSTSTSAPASTAENKRTAAVPRENSNPVPHNNGYNGSQEDAGAGDEDDVETVVTREPVAPSSTIEPTSRDRKMAVKINNLSSAVKPVNSAPGVHVQDAATSRDNPTQQSTVAVGGGKSGKGSLSGAGKANRNRTSSMPQMTPNSSSTTSGGGRGTSAEPRPAVIILNDERYNNALSSDITFGFDVNNQLLFGDFEEDEIRFLEPYGEGEGGAGKSGSHDALNDDSGKTTDHINTSDYNSYNSSLCSSSSVKATNTGTVVQAEGLVFDSNNNPSDETAEDLEVVTQPPQSTPKQQQQQLNVTNCTNCTRSGNEGVPQNEGGGGVGGATLMKNSCVQTSLDNLIMAPELNSNVVVAKGNVVTVSDLESQQAAAAAASANGGAGKKKKKGSNASSATATPRWNDADGEGQNGCAEAKDEKEFDSIKVKLQQFALINAQFARQAPMGWSNKMNSFFNNHENVINFVGLAWEDLTHNKSSALKYYNGQ